MRMLLFILLFKLWSLWLLWSDYSLRTQRKPSIWPTLFYRTDESTKKHYSFSIIQFSSVAQSCPTLCDSMDCSMPGLPVPPHLPEFAQVHVHCIGDAVSSLYPTLPTLFCFCPQSCPASLTFPMSRLFASDDQNTGAAASASVLPMKIQGSSPFRLTGSVSLLSKGLSGVFSITTVGRHWFFGALPSLQSSSHNSRQRGRP